MNWIDIHDRLPEKFVAVITLLFKSDHFGDMCINSIQTRNIQKADGSIVEVNQWAEENLRVTHWLDGVPKLPDIFEQTYEKVD